MKQEEWFKSEKFKKSSYNNRQKALERCRELKKEREEEYLKTPKLCKECGNPIPYKDHIRKMFCSSSCSAKYNNKHRKYNPAKDKRTKIIKCAKCGKEIEVNIRSGKYTTCNKCLQNRRNQNRKNYKRVLKNCLYCGKEFLAIKKLTKYCSLSCAAKHGHELGTRPSWKIRPLKSYPERFFEKVLKNNNLFYEMNKPIRYENKNYFLDFYFPNKNIDLEIDGKQHKYPERIVSDLNRDKILTKNGIKVFRIEWNSINTQEGKKDIRMKIQDFLDYYKSI